MRDLGEPFRSAAETVLHEAIEQRVTPGAVLVVAGGASPVEMVTAGSLAYGGPAVQLGSSYDLASLTKVIACLPALLKLLDAGELRLNDPVKRFFSNAGWFMEPSLGEVTLEELTLHASGLPAWKPMFAWVNTRSTAVANVLQTPLSEPRGAYLYSDLGVMVLAAVIERVAGERLDSLVAREVFAPLGMASVRFGPLPPGTPVAPTEDDGWRGRLLAGEVHDENASIMDGVSGHAGLFGTAGDLMTYLLAWLRQEAPFCSQAWLAEARRDRSYGSGPPRGLLWRLRTDDWSFGTVVSDQAYGHTGFTGTSVMIEPAAAGRSGWACVLLTNRVHPARGSADGITRLRRRVYTLVAETMSGRP